MKALNWQRSGSDTIQFKWVLFCLSILWAYIGFGVQIYDLSRLINFLKMGDFEPVNLSSDGEQHVIAAAQHILKALAASKNLTSDMRKSLADLENQLSTMTITTESEAGGSSEVEDKLSYAQKKVISWQTNQSMIWDSDPQEAWEYLQAVDEVRRLTENLGSFLSKKNEKEKELLDRSHSILQTAMARLVEELIHILAQNKQAFEPEYISFRSCEENCVYEESVISTEDESADTSRRHSSGTEPEEYIPDLVHPDMIPDIKSIANIMYASGYDQEFNEAFVGFWKDALDEYLINLGVEKLSIEDVMKMDWKNLNRWIKKWCRAIKAVVRFFLAGEKRLFDQVMGDLGFGGSTCFIEASKASMMCLLNFGEAVAIGPHQPEKLFCLIDMYEVLANLLQDIDFLFAEEVGSLLRIEFHKLLRRLADSVGATFFKFGNSIASHTSTTPFPNGGIHPITKYVMNYINLFSGYGDTLILLLEEQDREGVDPIADADEGPVFHPMARHLWSLTSMLETNLDFKSNLYRDVSLKHVFMMNNIHYMVHKVKDSETRAYFGDEWIRKHMGKIKQHATLYGRTTWCSVLSFLSGDKKKGKAILKERLRAFNAAFEEIYKIQTGWQVPDLQLREDLQTSTSRTLIHAYQSFLGRNTTSIRDKYIKYTVDELEQYILRFYEGSPRSLQSFLRR